MVDGRTLNNNKIDFELGNLFEILIFDKHVAVRIRPSSKDYKINYKWGQINTYIRHYQKIIIKNLRWQQTKTTVVQAANP